MKMPYEVSWDGGFSVNGKTHREWALVRGKDVRHYLILNGFSEDEITKSFHSLKNGGVISIESLMIRMSQ